MKWRALLPGVRDYRDIRSTWKGDLAAGVTVGIVALPLALAFGVSSGAGAESGLITAIIAGIIAAVFGGSHVQVSGPTGAMVVVLGPVIAQHGVAALPVVTVLAGLIVVAAGVFRLGRAVSFLPWPVIEGFTLGIAITIALQQVPAALGTRAGHSSNAFVAAVQAVPTVQPAPLWASLFLAAVVAVCMIVLPRFVAWVPASIVAIVITTVIATVAHLPVASIGTLPNHLPAPQVPTFSADLLASLAGPALAIAALASIESLLSARVAASLSNSGRYDSDRELLGQGLASIASGLFGGMPATGAIARTAVNIRAGGRSRVAAIVHAVVLLIVVYLASGIVSMIPLPALAGVLIVTAGRMVSVATIRTVIGSTRSDAVVFLVTAVITVSVDLIYAVGIGIAVAGILALRTLARTSSIHAESLPEPAEVGDGDIHLYRIDGALFFAAAERMLSRLETLQPPAVVILRMSQLQQLDASGAQVITEVVTALERRGITVLVKGIQLRHQQLLSRVGLVGALSHPNHLFTNLPDAVAHARDHVRRAAAAAALQESR